MRQNLGVWALCGAFVALLVAGQCLAAEPAAASGWAGEMLDTCCFGGDIRIRQVHFDDIPIVADPPGVTRGGENHFFRFRTRLWGEVKPAESVTLKTRLVNEFREWDKPSNGTAFQFADEWVVDLLYLDIQNVMDGVNVRIGRQELIYGTGKVILEGTPKDGSRTIYMDAVKLSMKASDVTTVDLFGIYNQPENELVINKENRDLTGLTKAYNDMTESGGGMYVKSKLGDSMPAECYYVFKDESDWISVGPDGVASTVSGRQIHTAGVRLMPKLCDTMDAAVEGAYQIGEVDDSNMDIEAYMVDATVNWHMPICEKTKPCLGIGVYMLSGDDPGTTDKDEGWNPLWARWPQYSELYIYAFDADGAGRWSNVQLPHVNLTLKPSDCMIKKIALMGGLLLADQDDGPGTGDERGWLGTARVDFQLGSKLLTQNDKLTGHLLAEMLDPGDYYNVTDSAHFLRWELSYAF